MAAERNIRLTIAFDGTDFNGWQRQKHDRTIQGEIERCLTRMTTHEIMLHGAGRTDAGVHADGMVANFFTTSVISCTALQKGLNSMLPAAIRIAGAEEVPASFHARFSAVAKHYEYHIYTGTIMPPRLRLYALHVPAPLDIDRMGASIKLLLGTHDFSTFENAGSREKDKPSRKGAVRTIVRAEITTDNLDSLIVTVVGEGFLRHMVRNIVGTLLEVGSGKRGIEQFRQALAARDRCAGGATAPPQGLRLKEVLYRRL
ncbi:MAG: tRNA pseudouridine(38-40) synthase TruA [Desulfopila sp.]